MRHLRIDNWNCASWSVLFAMALTTGCCTPKKNCNDISPGAVPQPSGTYLCQWEHAQTARADQDNFVIYQYEWSADEVKLTRDGQAHLACIAQRLPQVPFPVVIDASSDDRLNELRRQAVLQNLNYGGNQVPIERVIVARPEAEGLYSQEAPGIAVRMLGNTGTGFGQGMARSGVQDYTSGGTQGSSGGSPSVGVGVGVF